jgi:UDP-N-acetylmuramate dehydrogenase
MPNTEETIQRLTAIPNLQILTNVPLSRYTRFGIGGPADILSETASVEAFLAGLRVAKTSGLNYVIVGAGTNLIVSDAGFRGIVMRFTSVKVAAAGNRVTADAGAELQSLVDFAIEHGLKGLETLTHIPGSVGAAIYGNAGAYGHSISERIIEVRFIDDESVRIFEKDQCEFRYRESVFKRRKGWIILSAELALEPGNPEELRRIAAEIQAIRDRKFPPTMKCAGSIFKNLVVAELVAKVAEKVPVHVIRDGKAPAAWFLEQAGAKGTTRGDIHVADYHANLIYNAGHGTAADLCALIAELKARVRERFGLELEEEVQYVGFG